MYISANLHWGYLIILWLFHLGISWTVVVVTCTVVVLTCFVMCGCVCVGFCNVCVSFGNMLTCIYCVLYCLYCFCIVSFMYMFAYLFCPYWYKDYRHRVTSQLQVVRIWSWNLSHKELHILFRTVWDGCFIALASKLCCGKYQKGQKNRKDWNWMRNVRFWSRLLVLIYYEKTYIL
jgi:hypothetical protein